MSWQKLSDDFWRHRKVAALGDRALPAAGLWALALSWVGEAMTDGFVPQRQLAKLAGEDVTELAEALVDAGLWVAIDGGFVFHEYLERNPSRDDVLAARVARHEATSTAGKARAQQAARTTGGRFASVDAGAHAGEDAGHETSDAAIPVSRLPSPANPVSGRPARPRDTTEMREAMTGWDPSWDAFTEAWEARGFRWPPTEGQREALWPVIDARPNDAAGWVRAAPRTHRADQVVGFVLARWQEVRKEAGLADLDPGWLAGPTRGEAAESVSEIMRRLAETNADVSARNDGGVT
jgi:hypothetical protein